MVENTGLTVALILVAVAVLIQAGAMLGIYLAIRKVPDQIESVRTDVKQRLDPLTQSAQSALEIVNNSREPLRTISANLAEISTMLRQRTVDADLVAAELLDKSRLQIVRVDRMVTDLVDKVETTASAVQKGVLVPIAEVSAVVKGVRSGLEFLFKRRRVTNVSEATQDEQLFI
jgi:transcriptional regulator with PAS, ATPase and Fis domain